MKTEENDQETDQVSEDEFKTSIAEQFDWLRKISEVLATDETDFVTIWQESRDNVLAHQRRYFDAGGFPVEWYEYVVNFWLDNFATRCAADARFPVGTY